MTSFLGELYAGRLRWDLICPFPRQDPADRDEGVDARTRLSHLLDRLVDAELVETTGSLPAGLERELAAGGFLAMSVSKPEGGLGLSPLNVFRLLETATEQCSAAGIMLAWHNLLGAAAYPELLTDDLRAEVMRAVVAGAVTGLGDSEPAGAAHAERTTVAVPTAGGYLLSGQKLFVGNGSNADLITVSATVPGHDHIGLFLVDTTSAGFSAGGVHDLVGLKGSPIAAFQLDRVFVPADRMLTSAAGAGWRALPAVMRRNAFARMAITVTQTLAQARASLGHVHEFLGRRLDMNGRPLAEYDAVQRRVAACLADVFAVDSVVEWCLLGAPDDDRLPELTATKNIGTMTSWRVIDRAVSLMGGEGLETAGSKHRRGAPPLPTERLWRDARCLRVAGGVDFNVDFRCAWSGVFAPLYRGQAGAAAPAPMAGEFLNGLPAGGQRHARFVADQVSALRRRCEDLAAERDAEQMAERQEVLIAVSRLADELFTMAVVLARAAGQPTTDAWRLANVYCAGSRLRVLHQWQVLDHIGEDPDYAALTRSYLATASAPPTG